MSHGANPILVAGIADGMTTFPKENPVKQDPKDTRVVSANSAHEDDRVPEHGETPRVSDELLNAKGGPDADHHSVAAANTVVDEEAGASGDDDDGGGITPLTRRGS